MQCEYAMTFKMRAEKYFKVRTTSTQYRIGRGGIAEVLRSEDDSIIVLDSGVDIKFLFTILNELLSFWRWYDSQYN